MDAGTVLRDTGSGFVPAANGEAVARWVDKSANAHILAQTVSGNRPLLSTTTGPSNGRCLIFDGTDDRLVKTSPVFDFPCTVFSVVKLLTDLDIRYFWDTRASMGRPGEINRTGGLRRNGSNIPTTTISQTVGDWDVITSEHSTTEIAFRKNGGTRLAQAQSVTPAGATGYVIGGLNPTTPTNFTHHALAEKIAFGRILNSTEQDKVRNYLKVKWGTP
jgi:hypothetical protein